MSKKLLFIFILGALFHLAVAPFWYEPYDVQSYFTWAHALRDHISWRKLFLTQPVGFIAPFPSYISYLPWLWLFGQLPWTTTITPESILLLKLPTIAATLSLAWLCAYLVRSHGERAQILAALLAIFHPALLIDGSVWGQTDIFPALSVMSAIAWPTRLFTGPLVAIAIMFKLYAIPFLPLAGFLATRIGGWKSFWKFFLTTVATLFSLLLPFFPLHSSLFQRAFSFPYLSLFALNIWWPFQQINGQLMSDAWQKWVGMMLFTLTFLLVVRYLWQHAKSDPSSRWLATSYTAFAFYMLNTQMHERYLLLALPLLVPALFLHTQKQKPWLVFLTLSLTLTVNLFYVFYIPWRNQTFWPDVLLLCWMLQIATFVLMTRMIVSIDHSASVAKAPND